MRSWPAAIFGDFTDGHEIDSLPLMGGSAEKVTNAERGLRDFTHWLRRDATTCTLIGQF